MSGYENLTQHQKILMTMCRANQKDWFLPADFMDPHLDGLFVGYEASARLSELATEYPDMIESQRDGKYIKRRLRMETMNTWLPLLAKDLRYIFHRNGLTAGYKKHQQITKGPIPGQVTMAGMPPAVKKRIMI